ncbi:hypothetical protein TNCT_380981 [Trichonephila clavata]|uniref:Uncharacterized protein n=1 Tax=Trichonephila clavata TaxID=2740835 RepID=A0A8X6KTJ0_TRICU|nr:hypothetical protein TNCT_380981 [Trichonephila clavata]
MYLQAISPSNYPSIRTGQRDVIIQWSRTKLASVRLDIFTNTACYEELLKPYFIRLEPIIHHCTPEKIFLLNYLSSNLDAPDIELTVKELTRKLTEEHCMDLSDSYLFSISDPDESA